MFEILLEANQNSQDSIQSKGGGPMVRRREGRREGGWDLRLIDKILSNKIKGLIVEIKVDSNIFLCS
jgi:hypothetical protein